MPPGSYRLVSNKVEFAGDEKLPSSEVTQYIRQQPNKNLIFGWSPGLSIYNWSNGSGEGINKFWESVGEAPVIFDPALVESSKVNIAGNLQALGYYGSKVDAEIELKDRLARVKYIVTPGKRIRIDRILYEVPEGSFAEAFRADSANISVKEGDFLAEKTLEAETVRSTSVLRNEGYYDLSKNHYSFEADTLTDVTTLYYRIRGYTRSDSPENEIPMRKYHIGDVRIYHPSNVPFKENLLRKYNKIKPGEPYSEQLINVAYSRFSALRLFNGVSIEMTPVDTTTVDCDIRLDGGDLFGVKANIEGSTNSSGLMGFSPQLTVYNKNIFHGGEWLTLGFSGTWQWLVSSGAASSEFGITASLSLPRLLGVPLDRIPGANIPRTEFSASFNYRNRPEYRRALASFKYGYSGQVGRNFFYQVNPLQIDFVKLFAIDGDFLGILVQYPYLWDTFVDHIDSGVGGMVYYTTNSDVVPKTAYHYARFSMDVSGNFLSLFNRWMPLYEYSEFYSYRTLFGVPYRQYIRGELNLGKTFRFGWENNQALAAHFVVGAGWAYGNSVEMPFEKQFYCGGAGSMRGWQARMLGPGYAPVSDIFVLPSQTGQFKLEMDLEYRFPMFWKLEGALFAEAGNVWNLKSVREDDLDTFSWGSVAADWGFGVRVNLDFILLRLDSGFRLYDPVRAVSARWVGPRAWFKEGCMAVHFGVGYPF